LDLRPPTAQEPILHIFNLQLCTTPAL
jgi:hypothetical protein